jgi:broad specificity phosphatase PhoE
VLRLHLIRHGETAWSLSGRHTGRTELPLTPHGEGMARDLAPLLGAAAFTLVLTSPRLRSRRTCELAGLGDAAVIEPDLAEWDYGDYEGLRGAQIRAVRPDWDIWRDGCPGGETPADAGSRADRLIARLQGLRGDVALFSHGHFGRLMAVRWIGLRVFEGGHFAFDPATIGILGFEAGHARRRVICLWNAPALRVDAAPQSESPGAHRTRPGVTAIHGA